MNLMPTIAEKNVEVCCNFLELLVIIVTLDLLVQGAKRILYNAFTVSSSKPRKQSKQLANKTKYSLAFIALVKVFLCTQSLLVPKPTFDKAFLSNDVSAVFDNSTATYKVIDSDVRAVLEPRQGCRQDDRMILLVLSSPNNTASRANIRRKYGNINGVFILFLLGQSKHWERGDNLVEEADTHGDIIEDNLVEEAGTYGDILQGSMYESYKALSHKTLLGFIWTAVRCSQARYIVKIDDNVEIDLAKLSSILTDKYGEDPPDVLECPVVLQNLRPSRQQASNTVLGKWATSREAMPWRVLPDFCSGWLYVLTPRVGLQLAEAARDDTLTLALTARDDAYVTGFLRERIPHIKPKQIVYDWSSSIPCPMIGFYKLVFLNEFVTSKASNGLVYIKGWKFSWCMFWEFFVLERIDQIVEGIVPQAAWDMCAR